MLLKISSRLFRIPLTIHKGSIALALFDTEVREGKHEALFSCAFCASLWLLFFLVISALGLPDAKLFQPVLERAESEAEEFRGLGDVVVSLLHRLRDEVALDVF